MSHFTFALTQWISTLSQTPKIKVPQGATEVVGFVGWMKNNCFSTEPNPPYLLYLWERPAQLT